ncbi:MAG: hypothetical protein LBG96_17295 [Tannerella sp.]|nr:hypothetical protein [Tannerella sp.]
MFPNEREKPGNESKPSTGERPAKTIHSCTRANDVIPVFLSPCYTDNYVNNG